MAGPSEGVSSPFRVKNVQLYFFSVLIMVFIASFSLGTAFDAYLLTLAKSWGESEKNANTFVGSVETVNGLVTLFSALPLGIIADKVNRRRMLQGSSIINTLAIAVIATGITQDRVPLLYGGMVLNALGMQILMSVGMAFLGDCVSESQLMEVVTWTSTIFMLGFSVGPVVQIAFIYYAGNQWKLQQLHFFLCAGFALWPLAIPPFFMMEKTRAELSDLNEALAPASGSGQESSTAEGTAAKPVENGEHGAEAAAAAGRVGGDASSDAATTERNWKEERVFGIKKKWFVPLLIEFCSLCTACGAGMTLKFFPLFFKEDYGFSPIELNVLSTVSMLSVAVFVQLCRMVSKKMGPCQAALLWHVLGTSCLFLLWKIQYLPLLLAVYLTRGAFMNAKGPIDSAIVMDCVEAKYRGRWTALQSVSQITWSGSAILGGWLADSHDYRYTFLITACIYTCTGLMYAPLVFLVPKPKTNPQRANSVCATDNGACTTDSS